MADFYGLFALIGTCCAPRLKLTAIRHRTILGAHVLRMCSGIRENSKRRMRTIAFWRAGVTNTHLPAR
jgi:hypothetical protein